MYWLTNVEKSSSYHVWRYVLVVVDGEQLSGSSIKENVEIVAARNCRTRQRSVQMKRNLFFLPMTVEHDWVELQDRADVVWENDFLPWSFPFHVDDSNSTSQTKYETRFSIFIRITAQTFFQSAASADVCNSVVVVKCSCKSRYLRRYKNRTYSLFDLNGDELTLGKSIYASCQRIRLFLSYPHGYWSFSVDAMCYSDWRLDRGRVLISAVVLHRHLFLKYTKDDQRLLRVSEYTYDFCCHSDTFASSVEFPPWMFGGCHSDAPQQWYDALLFCSLLQRNKSHIDRPDRAMVICCEYYVWSESC